MKKLTLQKQTLLTALTLSALMAPALTTTARAEHHRGHKDGPCRQLKESCEAAGFVKGGHDKGGKGLWKDCIEKLMAGETVAGVTVTADQISGCKAAKEKFAERRAEKRAARKAEKAEKKAE